jgi:nitrate reductase beta subunit
MDAEKETKKPSKLPVYCVSGRSLDYEEWCAKYEDSINTELAETGADREMDFDSEREFEKRYEMYLNAQ